MGAKWEGQQNRPLLCSPLPLFKGGSSPFWFLGQNPEVTAFGLQKACKGACVLGVKEARPGLANCQNAFGGGEAAPLGVHSGCQPSLGTPL